MHHRGPAGALLRITPESLRDGRAMLLGVLLVFLQRENPEARSGATDEAGGVLQTKAWVFAHYVGDVAKVDWGDGGCIINQRMVDDVGKSIDNIENMLSMSVGLDTRCKGHGCFQGLPPIFQRLMNPKKSAFCSGSTPGSRSKSANKRFPSRSRLSPWPRWPGPSPTRSPPWPPWPPWALKAALQPPP